MNVLILGGTRFVGKRLVHLLADQGHSVTVGSRGRARVTFPDSVQRVTLDRTDKVSLKAAASDIEWDIVYDQLCYSGDDGASAVEVFAGKARRFIMCSSAAVYTNPQDAGEDAFDPQTHAIPMAGHSGASYAEGKRQAEAVLFQRGGFPVVAVRFPIILGPDDYTKRLRIQVQRVANNEPINIQNPDSEISLISSAEAAAFLAWLSGIPDTGPFNACSDGPISLKAIVHFIEKFTGRSAIVKNQPEADPFSLFAKPISATISTRRAGHCGFRFQQTHDWLPDLLNNPGT